MSLNLENLDWTDEEFKKKKRRNKKNDRRI